MSDPRCERCGAVESYRLPCLGCGRKLGRCCVCAVLALCTAAECWECLAPDDDGERRPMHWHDVRVLFDRVEELRAVARAGEGAPVEDAAPVSVLDLRSPSP